MPPERTIDARYGIESRHGGVRSHRPTGHSEVSAAPESGGGVFLGKMPKLALVKLWKLW